MLKIDPIRSIDQINLEKNRLRASIIAYKNISIVFYIACVLFIYNYIIQLHKSHLSLMLG